jgi:hypothetical protein
LALIPGFPGFRRYSGGEHFDANALTAQDVLQPLGDVALLRVDSEDLSYVEYEIPRRPGMARSFLFLKPVAGEVLSLTM